MSAELMKLKFHPSPSHPFVRPCHDYFCTPKCSDFFQILIVASPRPYARIVVLKFWNKEHIFHLYDFFFSFSLISDHLEAKRYSPYKSQPKVFEFLLNFLQNGLRVCAFWKFEIFPFFSVFVNMGPNRSETFKTILLLQNAAKRFQTCHFFSCNGLHKATLRNFYIFSFRF